MQEYKLFFGQTADYQVYGLSGIKPAYYQVSSAILLQPADYEVKGLFDGQYAGFFNYMNHLVSNQQII